MKNLLAVLMGGLAAFLLTLAIPANGQDNPCPATIEAPTPVKAGDWATRITKYGSSYKFQVTQVKEGVIGATWDGSPREYNLEWGTILSVGMDGGATRYQPAVKVLEFPLQTGKRWSQELSCEAGRCSNFTWRGEVVGIERIKLSKGDFCAARVEHKNSYGGFGTCWYVPGVPWFAKCQNTKLPVDSFEVTDWGSGG